MYEPSFWERSVYFTDIDVCVVGSGIVGLCASIFMKQKQPNLNILVLDNSFLPYGASSRNAGFACFGSITELIADLKNESEDEVFNRVSLRWEGLKKLRNMIGDDQMDYEPFGGYELFDANDTTAFEVANNKLDYFNSMLKEITGIDETYTVSNEKIPDFKFQGFSNLINNKSEGQIDTGKLMKALLHQAQSLDVNLISSLGVKEIHTSDNKVTVQCENGFEFNTSKCLIATNGFAKKFLPSLDVNPARAQVLITKPIKNLPFKGSFHYNEGYYYFRNVKDRILFGGGRNLDFTSETTSKFGVTSKIQSQLEKLLHEKIAPNLNVEVDMRWSGIMGLGKAKSALIQETDKNVYCAVRLGGMGVAIGSTIGEQAANLVLGKA